MTSLRLAPAALLLSIVLAPLASVAAQPPPDEGAGRAPPAGTAEEAAQREAMRGEVEEAARAIGAYTMARREQALQQARQALATMDERIARMDQAWTADAARFADDARAARERARADLRNQRGEAAARYAAMQSASADTWTRVRDRFVASYRALGEAVRDMNDRRAAPAAAPAAPADDAPGEVAEDSADDAGGMR